MPLPAAVIKTTEELDQWLAGVRQQVQVQLQKGPAGSACVVS